MLKPAQIAIGTEEEPLNTQGTGAQGQVERTLAVLEILAQNAAGLSLFELAERLRIPRSATHRILTILVEQGYVRQERHHGAYLLTAKIASLGFTYLARAGVTDLAQPVLDKLARACSELVRLALLDEHNLTWVARAQGSPYGLRYDPEMGQTAQLSCSANGIAWLMTLSDETATAIVTAQGLGKRSDFGPRAPESIAAFLKLLRTARKRGYSEMIETFAHGMAAMAVPVRHAISGEVVGTVSIAGPHLRLTPQRMAELAPKLIAAAEELSHATVASPLWNGKRRDIFGSAEP